jgi:hypothetical protein
VANTTPAREPNEPDEDARIREMLEREAAARMAHVQLTLVRKGVPFTTRDDTSAKSRNTTRWLVLGLMCVGAIQALYGFWSARSSVRAASWFHTSASCQMPAIDSALTVAADICRNEPAVVVAKTVRWSRNSKKYFLATASANGTRDNTQLARWSGTVLWRRLQPTQHIVVQRFVAPGFYLTGRITAVLDSTGAAMTRYHPDSGTHYEIVNALTGTLLFACTLAIYLKRFRADPR